MSMDGSFSVFSELQRLISRCPKLGQLPVFTSLIEKGGELKEEEVVNVLASVFLHPSYTIPVLGCFRPIGKKIVDRVVELLKLVPGLKFDDHTGAVLNYGVDRFFVGCEEFVDIEAAGVIEVYARNQRFLDLHELASFAFCRVLDLAPFLKGTIDNYYEFGGPPFARFLDMGTVSQLPSEAAMHLRDVVWTSYRILLLDSEYFSSRWNWFCFLDLLHHPGNFDVSFDVGLARDIRWCVVQILCVLMRLPSRTIASSGIQPAEALTCLLRWHEFCWDVSVEKASWYTIKKEASGYPYEGDDFNRSMAIDVMKLLECEQSKTFERQPTGDCSPFLLTSSIKKSIDRVVLAVKQRWPILLYGPPGSGKTTLINKIARESGNQVLSIHLDEQIDGRTLVGSYVCTEQPGEFRWQPGPLTQAVKNGFWVVFENIDQAASDVQSILLPLLEGGTSFTTGYGEAIRVARGFQLFSTISTTKVDVAHRFEGRGTLSALWRRVMITPATTSDLVSIVTAQYPALEPIAGNITETFKMLGGNPESFTPGNATSISRFSLRELLKWCKRIAGSGFSYEAEGLSADMRYRIYQEAVDVFAAYASSTVTRLSIIRSIAKIWAVLVQESEALYSLNKPVLQELHGVVQIGRVYLERGEGVFHREKKMFVPIRSSFHVLEKIACSVKWNEAVLLVGETGTGKTTLVQTLATRLGQKLTVLNLSQQSDVADLLGGFKPMDPQYICIPLYREFENLFSSSFSLKDNENFLACLKKLASNKNWSTLLNGFQKGVAKVLQIGKGDIGTKRKRPLEEKVLVLWENFAQKVEISRRQISATSGMIFSFVEGAFVTALRNGEWILLDEVNLAPPETLQRIIGVLDGESGSLCLAENGLVVDRHPNFRMFACMNPATDAGKRDLPYSLRSRFTEYFVDDVLEDEDLAQFVNQFLGDICTDRDLVNKIVGFYKAAKKDSEERLQDGANQKPQFSLRSLYRALEYIRKARNFGFKRALYDGFCMFFVTLLDDRSAELMKGKIVSYLLGGEKQLPPPVPLNQLLENRERHASKFLEEYVITKSVEEHIRTLARAAFIKRYPVLLQGPTSSGKTSLVQYLAAETGREFVRINNHEHTDLQEYLGSYITDTSGRLVFHEGVLVKAVRNGHWIVLDELNLAPSDVLEALNRLLDDNRELFVPELRETVRAHPDFMLFATQNPPTFYGGRKILSRAFRNRFVEIHVDEIPEDELTEILKTKGKVSVSYAQKMIEVMKELQLRRQHSKVFAGKHGFITPRDLFRWANRYRLEDVKSEEDMAKEGYYLLAERLRNENEKDIVQEVLDKHLRGKLKTDKLYKQGAVQMDFFSENIENIVWTRTMQRLYFLVERCYQLKEPVLLVGETGGGKTTVCQILSMALKAKLHILNCHQYTETSDFIGGFYPVRERSSIAADFKALIDELLLSKAVIQFPGDINFSSDISKAPSTLNRLTEVTDSYKRGLITQSNITALELASFEKMNDDLYQLYQKWQTIFIWQDGPLVQAMKSGDLFLVDEISLADDSVLERLNSVLEADRKLSLAEKGGPDLETVTAHNEFFLLATMNPGGDYGKKELSPALRNRFTEIWVPSVSDLNELRGISKKFLSPQLHNLVDPLVNFWDWFNELQSGRNLTVRDLLAWLDFVTKTEKNLHPNFAFLHGAFLVLLDGVSLGTGLSKNEASELRGRCLAFLVNQLKETNSPIADTELLQMENYGWADVGTTADSSELQGMQCDNIFGIHPFYIEKGTELLEDKGFEFFAPTTRRNVLRVLRAMQLPKPVLLEGSPGVGKTSLIAAIGKYSGHKVVRINLSEQTDIMDLLGSDLPVESEAGLQFAWSDGILLQALREGSWVLLDEINLAQQSVLEGLNAILDHRAEVFIPELGRSFKCPPSFRVFACQNPSHQGGGRKGLPKSFLNRFTKVYVDELGEEDYLFICGSLFPKIPKSTLAKLIMFNKRLYEETMIHHKFSQEGAPWEFNLRDVIRSCQIVQASLGKAKCDGFLNIVYVQRMRTPTDRREVLRLYEEVFGVRPSINPYPRVQLDDHYMIVGDTNIKRNNFQSIKTLGSELRILPGMRNTLEATVQCIQHQWLCILVGPTCSGKTSLIRLLAHLTGNVLNEINLSSATDISELLGSFEQYNAYRNFRSISTQVESYVNEYCSLQLDSCADEFLRERKSLITKWLTFSSNINSGHMSRLDSTDGESWMASLSLLAEIVELLKLDLERHILSVSWSLEDLSKILLGVYKLQELQSGESVSVKFEWTSGLLIKAVENGEWIVLEDANLCNPTVLDRINSLAESNGSITVNECGNVDGKPLVLSPHPNFRMFLTVNPSHGDVSRAMRNRGVEIVMMQPHWLLDEEDQEKIHGIDLEEVKRFLALSNIPNSVLVNSMAKAHMHARNEGLRLDVQITYLELGRWVHLFQQLLMTGNDLLWSLHKSWEHSYLSSLGESTGWDIVNKAKDSYLTSICSFGSTSAFCPENGHAEPETEAFTRELTLCLPGGWPSPLELRDFVWHSKEASVKQSCMFLEFLGVQRASYELNGPKNKWLKERVFSNSSKSVYLLDVRMLLDMTYPKGPNGEITNFVVPRIFEKTLTSKKLLFAADWVIDQATGKSDLELYLLWLRWFDSQLRPYCNFFGTLASLLIEELKHPIWESIFQIRGEVGSNQIVGVLSMPMLALDSAEVLENLSTSSAKRLCNAINSVGLLRRSLWQWNAETIQNDGDKSLDSVMRSLRRLEEEVLRNIIEPQLFDVLHQTYADLLEEHILFWNVASSSKFENLLVHWRALIKIVFKLRDFFPEAVENLLRNLDMMSMNLSSKLPYSLKSEKSLLWAHGGHPSLPSSADVFHKLQQLVGFVQLVWPRKIVLQKQIDHLAKISVSTHPELRFLAMQGVSMTSSVLEKPDEAESVAVKLEEMHEVLSGRFESEKKKLVENIGYRTNGNCFTKSTCCTISPEVICDSSVLESWMENLPVVDDTSLCLDFLLLKDLSEIVLADAKDLQPVLSALCHDVHYSLDFSINFSSRPPLDFVPHQEILWMNDAWMSSPTACTKLLSSISEMWFKWHSSLWNFSAVFKKDRTGSNASQLFLPEMLVKPVKTNTLQRILKTAFVMKDYHAHCFKLRVASGNIWRSVVPNVDLHSSLVHAPRSLLRQIISSHRKSFSAENFAAINSYWASLQMNEVKHQDVKALLSLLASARHERFASLVEPLIEPLVNDVFSVHSSYEPSYHIGCAWLRVGGLRFNLLLACDELDPAIKYSSKHLKLLEKCKSLALADEVRQHCNYLIGSLHQRRFDEQRARLMDKLEVECKRLQRKIVYRSDPRKFIKLKDECTEFSENVNLGLKLLKETELSTNLPSLIMQANNWQATATRFIDRLSEEYSDYIDIIQPIQVAIYEMKLGIGLLLSTAMQKEFLDRIQEKVDPFLDAVYSFMRFPRGHSLDTQVQINCGATKFPFYTVDFPACMRVKKMELLKKLISYTEGFAGGKQVSSLRLEASLFENILEHLVHLVANTKMLTNASFTVSDKVFAFFTSLWKDVKVDEETKRDSEAQVYKFRPRAFKLDDVCEVDLSTLESSFSGGDSFTEWKELLNDDESTPRQKDVADQADSSGDWNHIPESVLNNMVNVHNQLFGSYNLVESPGVVRVSDVDKLYSFVKSYSLGATMVKDLTGLAASSLDSSLVGEHMLRLCVEHEQKSLLPDKSLGAQNFYKDANPPIVARMVQYLIALRQEVLILLKEKDEDFGLQKTLEIIEMLLALPPSTSVAQALSGLQFLVTKVNILQENGAKFPFKNELNAIQDLVRSFQKMEFETWNTMLDDVIVQFEINAAKLWFPLYLVLHRGNDTDITEFAQSTLQSLEELIRTSNVGEFRGRLKLILSFYGQLDAGIRLGCYASCMKETKDVLYNVFGFYVQCLPIITDHIEISTKDIRKEMEDLLKLCRWDHRDRGNSDRPVSMENTKRRRQKLKKIVHKYTDTLQQPFMLVLTQEYARRGLKLRKPSDKSEKSQELSVFDISQCGDVKRTTWYSNWLKKVDDDLQYLPLGRLVAQVDEKTNKRHSLLKSPHPAYQEEWIEVWLKLEKICRTVVETADMWKVEGKSQLKTRAFSDLLKLLENSGLSKHRSSLVKILESNDLFNSKPALLDDELKSSQSNWWFFLPSHDVGHLLLDNEKPSSQKDNNASFGLFKSSDSVIVQEKWKSANQNYFKSLASVRHLQQISVSFHKDFMLDQVNRSNSFLEHLVMIQMEQRAAAYDFSVLLQHWNERRLCLRKLYSMSDSPCQGAPEGIVPPSLHHLLSFMWQQKELFDTLNSVLDEESLMLKTVQSTHFNTCKIIKPATSGIVVLIEHFSPLFKKSKAFLDDELLGICGSTTKVADSFPAVVMSNAMIHLVTQNFQLIRELEGRLAALTDQQINNKSIEGVLIGHFEDIIAKAKEMEAQFYSFNWSKPQMHTEDVFGLGDIFKHITNALQKLGSWSNSNVSDDSSLEKITSWKLLFSSYANDLQLNVLCKELDKIIFSSGKLANSFGVAYEAGLSFKHLEELFGLILAFSDGLLVDFLAVHESVSILTHRLAEMFASLFTEGYGVPTEEMDDDTEKTQDAKGTGMGEGVGSKDVSDEITDEDQLLSNKREKEEDAADELPSKDEKGIEMEQDFDADTYSVSEDSGDDEKDDDDDDQGDQLESEMGKTGDNSEAIDEKLFDKEEDKDLDGPNEKDESGPTVKDQDPNNRELKAKDDSDAITNELPEGNENESNDKDDDDDDYDDDGEVDPSKDGLDDKENTEEMNIDKDETSADCTGLDPDEPNHMSPENGPDEMEVDPTENSMDDGDEAEGREDDEMNNGDDEDDSAGPHDETLDNGESNEVGEKLEKDDTAENKGDENGNLDLTAPSKDMYEPGNNDSTTNQFPNTEASSQATNDDNQKANNPMNEMKWSMNSESQTDLAPSENASQMEVMVGDSSKGNITKDETKSHLPQDDFSSCQKSQPNPLRSIGDALQDWKDRVKVSTDLPDTNNEETEEEIVDDIGMDYGFVSENNRGTDQAIGHALPDQVDPNIANEKPDRESIDVNEDDKMEDYQNQEAEPDKSMPNHPILLGKVEEKIKIPESQDEMAREDIQVDHGKSGGFGEQLDSLVSLKKSHMAPQEMNENEISTGGDELGKVQNLVEQFNGMDMNAAALWRKYELRTSRLSQELAEQLRLVMEPTLASKLQGDYRTGKRINMKKVIPYIASHYRKDKIWLRRTKPNKRDYQVVIAVDDSRSMSENCCGDFAIEALVTVCRALSQLEVGKLAVASFGKQGNIKLLHDFDQPLTGEAGMKMISSLTFNQENTLRDEPMVDLLKYLNNMLGQAAANARLPSGQNPLQQLVLVIADGRFLENKEKLKRYMRDVLNRNSMVAFLVLDSGKESIMDLKECIFNNGLLEKAVPYLDSFPFPYYIVLRNIEALPRTLADLLRQWFELMQNSRD